MPDRAGTTSRIEDELTRMRERMAELKRAAVEHRKTAEDLRASRLQLSDAMDLARIVYWEIDPATGELVFNDPFYAFYGTTAEREGGYRMSREEYARRFLHPDDMPIFDEAGQRRLASTELEFSDEIEYRIVRRDGEVRHVRVRIHLTRDTAGRTIRYYGANQDITERKLTEEALARKTAFLEAIVQSTYDGIFVDDDEGQRIFQNRRYIELRKIPEALVDERDQEKLRRYCAKTAKDPEAFMERLDYLYAHPYESSVDELEISDGTILERYSAPVVRDGRHYGRLWMFHDVTERKRRENELRWETTFLETLLDSSQEGILVVDGRKQKVVMNRRTADLWKIPEDGTDDEGIMLHLMRRLVDPRAFFEKIGHLQGHPDGTVQMELELDDGTALVAYSSPVKGKDDEYYGRLWTFRDVTEHRRHLIMLENLSATDGLTGLANRRRFEEFFEQEWRRCTAEQLPLSLVLMDVDFFKEFNDSYGHLAGDNCLRQVGLILASALMRSGDLVARYGGEEFACVLPNTDTNGAEAIAHRIQKMMGETGIAHCSSPAADHVTLSFGVATLIPQEGQRSSDLLQLADEFLYSAKQNGRDQVRSWRARPRPLSLRVSV